MSYRGTRFRSTLEADWAATFDSWGMTWQYEPVALELEDGTQYLPDFFLPLVQVWTEVKGPHDERLDKPEALNTQIWTGDWPIEPFVVVLRPPGPGDRAVWEGCNPSMNITISDCPHCDTSLSFADFNGPWICRRCKAGLERSEAGAYGSGELHFARAPRPQRRAT